MAMAECVWQFCRTNARRSACDKSHFVGVSFHGCRQSSGNVMGTKQVAQ